MTDLDRAALRALLTDRDKHLYLATYLPALESAVVQLLDALEQAEERKQNVRTLLAVLCGHSPDEPLFALIDEVAVVRERMAELEARLREKQTQKSLKGGGE